MEDHGGNVSVASRPDEEAPSDQLNSVGAAGMTCSGGQAVIASACRFEAEGYAVEVAAEGVETEARALQAALSSSC